MKMPFACVLLALLAAGWGADPTLSFAAPASSVDDGATVTVTISATGGPATASALPVNIAFTDVTATRGSDYYALPTLIITASGSSATQPFLASDPEIIGIRPFIPLPAPGSSEGRVVFHRPPVDGTSITIGNRTWTFVSAVESPFEVALGATWSDAVANLRTSISQTAPAWNIAETAGAFLYWNGELADRTRAIAIRTLGTSQTDANSETATIAIASRAGYTLGTQTSHTLTITKPTTPLPVVTVTAHDGLAAESATGADTGIWRFTVDAAATDLQIGLQFGGTATAADYTLAVGDAADGSYTPATRILTMKANRTQADLVLTPIDDAVLEGPETASIAILPGNGYTVGGSSTAAIAIADNEVSAYVQPIVGASTATEGGGSASFAIIFSPALTQPANVQFAVASLSGSTAQPPTSGEAAADWELLNGVTLRQRAPFVALPVVITHAAGGNASNTSRPALITDATEATPGNARAQARIWLLRNPSPGDQVEIGTGPQKQTFVFGTGADQVEIVSNRPTRTLENLIARISEVMSTSIEVGPRSRSSGSFAVPVGVDRLEIEVEAVDDDVVEDQGTGRFTLLGTGTGYAPIANTDTADIAIIDNEPTLSIATSSTAVQEGGAPPLATITAAQPPSRPIIARISLPMSGPGLLADYDLLPTGACTAAILGERSLAIDPNPRVALIQRTAGAAGVAASGDLVMLDLPQAGDSIIVRNGTATRAFVFGPGGTQVSIGASMRTTLANLAQAITAAGDLELIATASASSSLPAVPLAAGSTTAVFRVEILSDTAREDTEILTLALSTGSGPAAYRINPTAGSAAIAIVDDSPIATLGSATATAIEGSAPGAALLLLSRTASAPILVPCAFSGSATRRTGTTGDYTVLPTVEFAVNGAVAMDATVDPDGTRRILWTAGAANAPAQIVLAAEPKAGDQLTIAGQAFTFATAANGSPTTIVLQGNPAETAFALIDAINAVRPANLTVAATVKSVDQIPVPAGTSRIPIAITAWADATRESESATLTIAAGASCVLGSPNSQTIAIAEGPTVATFGSATGPAVTEGSTQAVTVAIGLVPPPEQILDLPWSISPADQLTIAASAGVAGVGGITGIPAGTTSLTLTIAAKNDTTTEDELTATITLLADAAGRIVVGKPGAFSLLVKDDDAAIYAFESEPAGVVADAGTAWTGGARLRRTVGTAPVTVEVKLLRIGSTDVAGLGATKEAEAGGAIPVALSAAGLPAGHHRLRALATWKSGGVDRSATQDLLIYIRPAPPGGAPAVPAAPAGKG